MRKLVSSSVHTLWLGCLVSGLCLGCVAGPEEMAAESKKQSDQAKQAHQTDPGVTDASMASTGHEEVVTASNEADAATPGFEKTNNGLKYRIIEEGTGKRPTATSTVVAHYRGWLDSGKEFDSSYKRGQPTEFPLNGVIAGWTEGLQLIKEGGKIELEIPSRLGYGAQGMPPVIPPNARLHFEIELVQVK